MDVRVLIVDDCPNGDAATALLRRALDDVGLEDVTIRTQVVTGLDEAVELNFTGSPTILVDGHDPFAQPGQPPAMACRLYRSPEGRAGIPEAGPLRAALERATHPARR